MYSVVRGEVPGSYLGRFQEVFDCCMEAGVCVHACYLVEGLWCNCLLQNPALYLEG